MKEIFDEAEQLKAVERNGLNLRFCYCPSEAVQLAAVKKDGYAIEYIDNPSEAVMKAALEQYPPSIRYFKDTWKFPFHVIKGRLIIGNYRNLTLIQSFNRSPLTIINRLYDEY